MEAIILRAMSLDPGARFESVTHLGAALLPFASPGPRANWTPLFTDGSMGGGYAAAEAGFPAGGAGAPGGGRAPSGGVGAGAAPSGRIKSPSGGLGAPLPGASQTGDAGRTMVLPQDVPAPTNPRTGGLRATPTPGPRRRSAPSSSTLRDATGEASAYGGGKRSRAPIIFGVTVAALAVGLILVLTVFHPGGNPPPRPPADTTSAAPLPSPSPRPAPPPLEPPPAKNAPPLGGEPSLQPAPTPTPTATPTPTSGDEPAASASGDAGKPKKHGKPGRHRPHPGGDEPPAGRSPPAPRRPTTLR